MNFLSLFVLIPLLMLLGLWLSRNIAQIRAVMVTGASALLVLSAALTVMYLHARHAGATDEMLFRADMVWYPALNIHYSVGVDGISVAMLLLSAIIVFTGTFASWRLQPLTKEYFLWFTFLSIGVFGFFISIDLFTMFMFYEVALIPMYLLIGVWGSGRKEYSAMKLTLMLMGGSAFLLIGILGIYYGAGATSMNLLEIAQMHNIPIEQQRIWFPLTFLGFGVLGRSVPVPHMEPRRSRLRTDCRFHAPCRCIDEVGRLRMFPHSHISDARSCAGTGMDIPHSYRNLRGIRCILRLCANRPEVYQCLLFRQPLRPGVVRHPDDEPDGLHGRHSADALSRTDDSLVLRPYRYDIRTLPSTRDVRELSGLMKIMPFLAVCYVIAGLANLGLPGLSGFIAEMTIFTGSFQHPDTFHRVWTVIACSSIVITAVYILRLIGKILYGTCTNKHHLTLSDATWDERTAVIILIACVAALGMAPWWISGMIGDSVLPIVNAL